MKLAFVVQRYGADIAGGSELHCRELAQRLAGSHDITILTSCARDYVTWRNEFSPGSSADGAVRVVRFPVTQPRHLHVFASLSDEVFDGGAPPEREEEWFHENGPQVPELLRHLREHGHTYDLVLFWTFRYFPSFFGLPLVRDRAVLVPTAEDDRAVWLNVLAEYFTLPVGYVFLTPEEETLVSARAGRALRPSAVVGIGLEPVPGRIGREPLDAHSIPDDYILYLGRVDRNKGCDTLLEYFQEYAETSEAITLVLAGPVKMQIPSHPRIRSLGYVSDDVRRALLAHARVLVVPSPYESLSIVLLEAWNHGVPALVNAGCKVLYGQVRRANGGLYYRSFNEFSAGLDYLRSHPAERHALGAQGLAFVEREYRWPTVVARVEGLISRALTTRAQAGASTAT